MAYVPKKALLSQSKDDILTMLGLICFTPPKPLPILTSSKFVPEKGFPMASKDVKELRHIREGFRTMKIDDSIVPGVVPLFPLLGIKGRYRASYPSAQWRCDGAPLHPKVVGGRRNCGASQSESSNTPPNTRRVLQWRYPVWDQWYVR